MRRIKENVRKCSMLLERDSETYIIDMSSGACDQHDVLAYRRLYFGDTFPWNSCCYHLRNAMAQYGLARLVAEVPPLYSVHRR